ncbi:hypothetical protein RDWZM_000655 [Blomia tropicalis]|uniref:NADH dehydrogenase [ubiquinone] 1 alpha subcomplex subunit 5 n=1 Tax=Blomia tropicalis TaxID=40697 RepID=A0A9Q0MEA4_BLOTA|nr:hypothetical protein RDWZM_000655 [Blomia tropicalis]
MAHLIKKSTGLTGLKVLKNPREELISVYNKIIKTLQAVPDNAAYKGYAMTTVKERLTVVQNEMDPNMIEKKIGCGQCEELLVQAENELSLARRFVIDKPWEPLANQPPPNQWKWPI